MKPGTLTLTVVSSLDTYRQVLNQGGDKTILNIVTADLS